MEKRLAIWTGLMLGALGLALPAAAQHDFAGGYAWRAMLEHDGVAFSYLFHRDANQTGNGVVVMLVNKNEVPVRYRFTIIFRSDEGPDHEERVEGTLEPGQAKTGSDDGLFWIPFTDGRSIAEVGLRGWKIEPEKGERTKVEG